LAGEAACVVDLTAEGIRPSIFSGLKASVIDQAIAGDLDALEKTPSDQRRMGAMAWRSV